MSNRFHLAVEAGDLSVTVVWYQEVLGCKLDTVGVRLRGRAMARC